MFSSNIYGYIHTIKAKKWCSRILLRTLILIYVQKRHRALNNAVCIPLYSTWRKYQLCVSYVLMCIHQLQILQQTMPMCVSITTLNMLIVWHIILFFMLRKFAYYSSIFTYCKALLIKIRSPQVIMFATVLKHWKDSFSCSAGVILYTSRKQEIVTVLTPESSP